jgi:hypothetical protein
MAGGMSTEPGQMSKEKRSRLAHSAFRSGLFITLTATVLVCIATALWVLVAYGDHLPRSMPMIILWLIFGVGRSWFKAAESHNSSHDLFVQKDNQGSQFTPEIKQALDGAAGVIMDSIFYLCITITALLIMIMFMVLHKT